MVEPESRSRVDSQRRATPNPQWEVFVREEETAPLRHVGSVAAESADAAHEHASRLFGWYAVDIWLTPAESVARFSSRPLTDAEPSDPASAEDDDGAGRGEGAEPRVYEETEGTPRANDDAGTRSGTEGADERPRVTDS